MHFILHWSLCVLVNIQYIYITSQYMYTAHPRHELPERHIVIQDIHQTNKEHWKEYTVKHNYANYGVI